MDTLTLPRFARAPTLSHFVGEGLHCSLSRSAEGGWGSWRSHGRVRVVLHAAALQICALVLCNIASAQPEPLLPLRCTFENTVRCTPDACERDTQDHFQELDLDFRHGIAEFCIGETCFRGAARFTTQNARPATIHDPDTRRLHASVLGQPPRDQRVGPLQFFVTLGLPSRHVTVTLGAPAELDAYFGRCETASQ